MLRPLAGYRRATSAFHITARSLGAVVALGCALTELMFAGSAGLALTALTLNSAPAAATAYIYSFSEACAGVSTSSCVQDFRFGDPATSSVSTGFLFVEPSGTGGINFSSEASAAAVPSSFSLFARAGGSSDGVDKDFGVARGTAFLIYND